MDFVSGWCLARFTLLLLVCTSLTAGVWGCEFVGRFLFVYYWLVCFGCYVLWVGLGGWFVLVFSCWSGVLFYNLDLVYYLVLLFVCLFVLGFWVCLDYGWVVCCAMGLVGCLFGLRVCFVIDGL